MDQALYQLFRDCFPTVPVAQKALERLLPKNTEFLTTREGERPVGMAAVAGKNILWLCTAPDKRGQGIGSDLLARAETLIRDGGHNRAVVGNPSSWLFIGAPCTKEESEEKHHAFLSKRGYRFGNSYVEMARTLADYDVAKTPIHTPPADVSFGWATEEEYESLRAAVAKVDRDWVNYFHKNGSHFVARRGGEVIGFTIVSFNDTTLQSDGESVVGNIGCVGVIPEERRGGTGLYMVALAAMELKSRGCDVGYIHYTHLESWYAKLGFETFVRVMFGEKPLL